MSLKEQDTEDQVRPEGQLPPSDPDERRFGSFDPIPGERGIPPVHRARSLQSRMSSLLAVGLMSALGVGLLGWYYAKALTRPARAQAQAQGAVRAKAQGEMALPALGPIRAPRMVAVSAAVSPGDPSLAAALLGEAPQDPAAGPTVSPASGSVAGSAAATSAGLPAAPNPAQLALARQLSGPVFSHESAHDDDSTAFAGSGVPVPVSAVSPAPSSPDSSANATIAPTGELNRLLQPTATPAVSARLLPTRRFLLPKGAFIDCTLETAIDSTYPGLTTCITATDTFSADGNVVLLERGTKLVGESQAQVQQGSARVYVLWDEARTPTGVVVPLSSPGTDELGRTGLPGEVNRHFWQRFGAAILITVIDGAIQAGVQAASSNNGATIVNPSGSSEIATEVLKSTVAIPPTITKPQGDRIQVLVARDIDFRGVYELKTVAAQNAGAP
jgi:type IV secretion system protein VirB10